jgi:hypothetical protein
MPESEPSWQRSIPREQTWGGCRACRHLLPGERCAAYPDGIPLIIMDGQVDHLVVRPGQVGEILFEVNERPTGLALIRIRGAVKNGEQWALRVLARSASLREALGMPEASPAAHEAAMPGTPPSRIA